MIRDHNTMNKMYEVNLILSAKAPVIKAGVIIANLSWKKANNINGMVGARLQGFAPIPSPIIKKVEGLPMIPPMLSPKARLNPTTTQIMVMTAIEIKL